MSHYPGNNGASYYTDPVFIQKFDRAKRDRRAYRESHGGFYTATDEQELLQKYNALQMAAMQQAQWNLPYLDVERLEEIPQARVKLPPFKLNYETIDEARRRLHQTVILIKGNPFYVDDVGQKDGKFKLKLLEATDGVHVQIKLEDVPDLRSAAPVYLTTPLGIRFLERFPERVYQQGLNQRNTRFRHIATEQTNRFDITMFCRAVKSKKDRVWSKPMADFFDDGTLSEIRLTDRVAVFHRGTDNHACYRGRRLGKIVEDEVLLLDEDDSIQPWVIADAKKAGLKLRA